MLVFSVALGPTFAVEGTIIRHFDIENRSCVRDAARNGSSALWQSAKVATKFLLPTPASQQTARGLLDCCSARGTSHLPNAARATSHEGPVDSSADLQSLYSAVPVRESKGVSVGYPPFPCCNSITSVPQSSSIEILLEPRSSALLSTRSFGKGAC